MRDKGRPSWFRSQIHAVQAGGTGPQDPTLGPWRHLPLPGKPVVCGSDAPRDPLPGPCHGPGPSGGVSHGSSCIPPTVLHGGMLDIHFTEGKLRPSKGQDLGDTESVGPRTL